MRSSVGNGFSLGYSGDWNAVEALLAGGEVWYSVIAGLFPNTAMAIVRAITAGDMVEARRQNARLDPLWDLFKALSSLRVVYAAADLLGLSRTNPPRPILPLSDENRRRVADVLGALELS